jgi:uncharacterized protein (AIM24 family)
MTAPTAYTCPYCRLSSEGATSSCPKCGAPVNVRLRTTSGGWTDMPPIADMTRIQAGNSTIQVEGGIAAIADWNLAAGDNLFFPNHMLLWSEPGVTLGSLQMGKPWTRHRAGMPMFLMTAAGPGHVAFSHGSPGELLAIPLQPGASVDVCEGRLLVATLGTGYDWNESGIYYSTSGHGGADSGAGAGLLRMGMNLAGQESERRADETEWHYPMGRYLDRFTATDRPGLIMIGASGNAYTRTLAEGESILVKPPALLFKDPSVVAQLHVEYPAAGLKFWRSWGNRYLWLRLWGPGRVGIESCYEPDADPGTEFSSMSQASQHMW